VLNGASTVADGAAITDSTVTLAQHWDKLSPKQRLMTVSLGPGARRRASVLCDRAALRINMVQKTSRISLAM
jgi:hypothetical protein